MVCGYHSREPLQGEVRRILIPRTPVNKDKERAVAIRPWPSKCCHLASQFSSYGSLTLAANNRWGDTHRLWTTRFHTRSYRIQLPEASRCSLSTYRYRI